MKGVDISHYQKGLTIQQVKDAGNEFAIIKLTEGDWLVDSCAFGFYREAYEMGFPIGCYCYSHAVTAFQARQEAAFLLKTINGFPMPCGIFLDVEEPKMLELEPDKLLDVIETWCEAIFRAGYVPGLYGSEYNLWAKIPPDVIPEYALAWVAHYGKEPDAACDLWQFSDSGSIPGYKGNVDTDEVRSVRFETLVDAGGCDYQYHHQLTPSVPDKPPDVCPVGSPLDLVADFLRTDACRELFEAFIAGRKG